jgi:putative colanic acid biosynthesis UDP-glucose lipid carrier transferase
MSTHYNSTGRLGSVPVQDYAGLNLSLRTVSYAAAAVDLLVILICGVGTGVVYHLLAFGLFDGFYRYLAFSLVVAALFLLVMFAVGAYRTNELLSLRRQFLIIGFGEFSILAFLSFIFFLLGISEDFSRGTVIFFAISSVGCLAATRLIWRRGFAVANSRGLLSTRRALLICNRDFPMEHLREQLADTGVSTTHTLNTPDSDALDSWVSKIDSGLASNINEIIVASRGIDLESLQPLLNELRAIPLPVRLVLDPFSAGVVSHPVSMVGSIATIEVQRPPLTQAERAIKRGVDIAISIVALLMLLPIVLATAVAIKLDSRGPVFFRQQRRGWNSEPFRILKFRSMRVMEDGQTVRQATRNDNRVTRVGAFIRSTSIDEIPQFWNVLMGDMSIVGPRPHAVAHDDHYDTVIAKYAFRRHVKPGITGWAQINGLRGETPTLSSMEQRVTHDLWYIHNWSFWLDLKIMARTALLFSDREKAY